MGRKVNFLGLEVEVVTDEEMQQAPPGTVMMLAPVDPVNDPETFRYASPGLLKRRLRVRCDQCRTVCWFDPESGWLSLPEGTPRLCIPCVIAKAEDEKNNPQS